MILNSLELLTENPATLFVGGSVFAINEQREEIEEELEKRLEKGRSKATLQVSRKTRRPYRKRKSISTHCKGALKRGILTHLKFEFR